MSLRYAGSYISVRAYDTFQDDTGRITDSRKARTTEISALQRMTFGIEIPASDAIGEARRAGKCQCKRCLQYKEPVEFSKYKKGKSEYARPYCKKCCVEMERTRRFSHVEPASPYPRRVE